MAKISARHEIFVIRHVPEGWQSKSVGDARLAAGHFTKVFTGHAGRPPQILVAFNHPGVA
jgi:hypothetical protein